MEVTAQVYKLTEEGLMPVHGSQIPRNIAVSIAIALQRVAVVLHPAGSNLTVAVDCEESDDDGDNHQ